MKSIIFARASAVLAVAGALSALTSGAFAGCGGGTAGSGLTRSAYQASGAGPVYDAYEMFVMSTPTTPAWETADGYGSQGFHHGLPVTVDAAKADVFAVDMIPYGATPDSAAMPAVEPVAGGADAMRDASIFTYTPDPDYGSRNIEHWLPQYGQD